MVHTFRFPQAGRVLLIQKMHANGLLVPSSGRVPKVGSDIVLRVLTGKGKTGKYKDRETRSSQILQNPNRNSSISLWLIGVLWTGIQKGRCRRADLSRLQQLSRHSRSSRVQVHIQLPVPIQVARSSSAALVKRQGAGSGTSANKYRHR